MESNIYVWDTPFHGIYGGLTPDDAEREKDITN